MDQIKTFLAENQFEEAAEVADTINWNKIKNVNALVKAGEVYEKVGRYEDSRDILLNAYDRSPIGRTIIYRLAEVAIKMKDFEAAQEYYDEFVDIAPHDNQRYVLKYRIKKEQGASYQDLVPILEEYKEQEYTEEWAFELAHLYHKAGMIDKCIDACDELILWFGDGPYVERSLELKMLYQPLTKAQEEKYHQFRHEKVGKTLIGTEEMERAGEYAHDPVAIPQVTLNPSRFNTANLQEEIVKGIQQIMDATEKETVVGTMDNIKKIAEEIPYLQLPTEEELAAKETAVHIETDEEIDGSLKINFQELLGEESDGQISLVMKEKAMLEQQITGQMTISDVLEEWEKTKRAAEITLQEAEQRKLESAKARALQEAEDIMDRLNDVIPKIEATISSKDIKAEETELLFESVNSILDQEIERLSIENAQIDSELQKMMSQEVALSEQPTQRMPKLESIPLVVPIVEEVVEESNIDISQEEAVVEEEEAIITEINILDEIEPSDEEAIIEETVPSEEIVIAIESEKEPEEEISISFDTHQLKIQEIEKELSKAEYKLPKVDLKFEELEDLLEENANSEKEVSIRSLTEEQKAIFSYFVPIKGMEQQLCNALSGIVSHLSDTPNSSTGNLIIQGSQGCGKTMLATSIVKVLQKECGRPNGRIGKIDADALNKKDVQQLLRKVAGGCLIIENAGAMDRNTAITLSLLLEQDASGVFVILEDSAVGIKKALAADEGLAKKFTETVTVPIFSNDDLVVFAKSYANELGYVIDEMAILALHNSISNIEKYDQATTLEEVKEIIDDAIDREAHGGLRKAFNILTAKRYTDDEKIVLTEKDFE